ncbi:MAG: M28 family peptidase [candidate division WOR-3 bacterium]
MCNKFVSLLLLFVFSHGATSLVKIELGENRLEPLFDRDLKVIRELDKCALVVVYDVEITKIKDFRFQILDKNPQAGDYYLVYKFHNQIDLSKFGEVLFEDNNVYLMKLTNDGLVLLNRGPVEIVRLSFEPIMRSKVATFPSVRSNPIIQEIVDKVSPDTVLSFVRRLQNFRTRYSTHDSCLAAANWIKNKFIQYGCDSVYFQYHTSGHAPNVIGIKFGVLYPNIYAVIDGHFDATSNQAPNVAPGADDNASGTVAALEAARVMKDYLFEYSARFIAFSGEEFGLYGSEYYADNARANGDSILGVLNGDMIGYVDASPENCDVLTNSANIPFADFFIACADTYTTLLTVKQTVSSIPSDIQPFYDNGYHGLCNIEDYWPTNPHYHTTHDTVGAGYNNNAFATEVIKAEIAALSVLIKPYGVSGMPAVPTIIKPFNFARLPVLQPTISFTSTDPQGDNIQYRVLWDEDPNFSSPDSATTISYPSGSIASFVFPAPLQNGMTYWWKVKCTDPGGTGLWTQYTERLSFTIGTSLPQNTCSWYQTTGAQFNYDIFNGTQVQGDSVVLLASGQTIVDTLLNTNFESGMPAGWTVVDGNNDNYKWTTGTTSDLGSYTPPNYGSAYAYYSDDDAGSGVINYNEELISPKVYIPSSATNLRINYGYGIRVYQTGEKMRVKFRKRTGGVWTAWTNIAEYTTSTSGTANIDLSGQLPCDSVQFEWFFSDSTASSHWGYACATDNVLITSSYTQSDFGTMTGTPVSYHNLSIVYPRTKWGDVVWHKATAGDSVGIQIEYYNGTIWQLIPNSVLPGNSVGFFTNLAIDTVKLTNVDTLTYHTLRLKGLFHRITKSPNTPSLLDWEVGNLSSYVVTEETDNSQSLINNLQLEVHPNPFRNHLVIKFQIPSTKSQTNPKSQDPTNSAFRNPKSEISLSIYDVSGRVVKSFDLESCIVNHVSSVVWDGCDDLGRRVPSGVYFVRFEVGDYKEIEKAVLLR